MFLQKRFSGDSRTVLIKKNIAASFFIKGWNGIVQLLLVPITLNCLNEYEYGIWLVINSMLIWIDQMDIGLGNGLRNKLAESIAKGERERARSQISTTFVMLALIIVPLLIIIGTLIYSIDCNKLLNVDKNIVPNFPDILFASVVLVGFTFVFKFIGNIYLGLQLPAVNNLLVVAGQTVALIIIFVLSLFNVKSLLSVAIAYTASPLVIYLISYPITFTRYSYLRPSLKKFDYGELKGLFSLGIMFFVLQLAALTLFASSNILISKLFTPADVTPYQISYRYFSLTIMLFSLISAPLWSATTDAYTKNDIQWIENIMKKMRRIMVAFALLLGIMLLVSQFVYDIWLGSQMGITFLLSGAMAFYMMVLIFSTCYSNMLFGIGKIRVITVVTVIEAVVYIPLAVLLGRNLGVLGVIIALIIVNMFCAITNRIQFGLIFSGKATGIWNK